MRTPIRKAGKYTHNKPDPYLTAAKIKDLKDHLQQMKKAQPKLAAEVKRLAQDGDFSENVPYQIAKGRLRGLNQRILDTENHLKSAIEIRPGRSDTVRIGSTVEVEVDGRSRTFTILGATETDPARGIISHLSPIGRVLLGSRVGKRVRIDIKGQDKIYLIKKIR